LNPANQCFKGEINMAERRQHERHAFSATAEVVDLASGARLSTRAADLNKGGCYLDMLSPLPIGSKVRIRISSDGGDLACTAVVRDSQPGMGMGVAFTDLNDAQNALIDSWIERLGSPGLAGHSPSPFSENIKSVPPPEQKEALAVKLIDLLHKKGLLSSNDVAALLRDRIL
jgi:hypothetical protein